MFSSVFLFTHDLANSVPTKINIEQTTFYSTFLTIGGSKVCQLLLHVLQLLQQSIASHFAV